MTPVDPTIDLEALAREAPRVAPPKRRAIRWLVPLAILAAFAAVLASTATDLFAGATEVTVVRPRAIAADGTRSAGSRAVLLQAAGWVEPDPLPFHATALVPGVVREVLVQESDVVAAGDPVASIFDEELRLERELALAAVERARADVARLRAEAESAQAELDSGIAIAEALAVAAADLEGTRAASDQRQAAARRSVAQVAIARDELTVQEELLAADAAGPRAVEIARARVEEALAAHDGALAEASLAKAQADAARARHERAQADQRTRFAERARASSAKAAWDGAVAALREAEVASERAALRLARAVVLAPAAGVVLERHVAPGEVLDGEVGTPVCTLYQPERLRVRVDVPQADLGKVAVGATAQISAETRPAKPYSGEVIRIVHKADIQKVTLQVHVRVLDGDALLRPEMLCQVRLLGGGEASSSGAPTSDVVLIPAALVDGEAVWVVDASGERASRRRIERVAGEGEWIEARGVNLSDKLIDRGREGLSDGARIRVVGGR